MEDEHITEADILIVKPRDKVRLVPVKEAIQSRVKVNGNTLFSGVTGDVLWVGEGKTDVKVKEKA